MNYLCLIFFFLCGLTARAEHLQVGAGKKYSSVRQAIREARNGDTLWIHPGVYREGNILIDKQIALIGINYPVFDGENKYEIISVKADKVLIKGLLVRNSGFASLEDPSGIKIYNFREVEISDNILENNFFGIYVQFGSRCLIKNNRISAEGIEEQLIGNGIHCWKSDSLQIIGNRVSGHRDGIYFEFVTASVIWRNLAFKNIRYGLHFMFSDNDAYIGNVFRNNGAGVSVMFTKRVKMFNNSFEQNWGDAAFGLLLKEISDSHIIGNRFINNTSGIYMEGTGRVLLENNDFRNNGRAMQIQASCTENIVRQNNFIRNTFDISTNGDLVLNTFDGNYWDRYEGYDLDKNTVGDIPYRPLSLFSVIVGNIPPAMLLYRSFIVTLLDKSEKMLPGLTPDNFIDNRPLMKALRK